MRHQLPNGVAHVPRFAVGATVDDGRHVRLRDAHGRTARPSIAGAGITPSIVLPLAAGLWSALALPARPRRRGERRPDGAGGRRRAARPGSARGCALAPPMPVPGLFVPGSRARRRRGRRLARAGSPVWPWRWNGLARRPAAPGAVVRDPRAHAVGPTAALSSWSRSPALLLGHRPRVVASARRAGGGATTPRLLGPGPRPYGWAARARRRVALNRPRPSRYAAARRCASRGHAFAARWWPTPRRARSDRSLGLAARSSRRSCTRSWFAARGRR